MSDGILAFRIQDILLSSALAEQHGHRCRKRRIWVPRHHTTSKHALHCSNRENMINIKNEILNLEAIVRPIPTRYLADGCCCRNGRRRGALRIHCSSHLHLHSAHSSSAKIPHVLDLSYINNVKVILDRASFQHKCERLSTSCSLHSLCRFRHVLT